MSRASEGPTAAVVSGAADVALPSGTVTFLLTDVERSTTAWEEHPDAMATAIARHYELLDAAIDRHGGSRPQEQGEGDSVVGAFRRASDALAAALDAQRSLQREPWPDGLSLRVRMGIHTGEAVQRGEDNYVGSAIIRTARIRNAGHGGQILVSESAAAIGRDALPDGACLVDLGVHRLKDLTRPERLWAVGHEDLPMIDAPLRTLDVHRHNLPLEPTPLIGRTVELADISADLAKERLVTLTGAGGIGKTRLAASAAANIIERFPGGVWWVDLAPLQDPSAIGSTLLAAMRANEDGARPALEVARDRLASDPALVVFDNCEHLLVDVAALIDDLRATCPELVVLATSREPLGLAGEVTRRVPSLSVPPPGTIVAGDRPDGDDAVTLFIDRVRRVRPALRMDAVQLGAAVEICRRLDGIPLAIELAAARCRQLAPERIASDLDERFRLLTGGARSSLPRQQTLLASVAWSHDLLDDDERALMRRLAVCAGTFRLGLAEAVGSTFGDLDTWAVLDVLGRLVDKSLVQADDHIDRHGHTDTQYRLLETIRQFGLDRARDAGELTVLRDAHADWWLAELALIDARQPTWEVIDLLGRHLLDVRAALDWLEPDPDRRHALLAHVGLGWSWGGHTDDALHYADRWLVAGPPDGADEVAWARAYAASATALFYGWRTDGRTGVRAFDLVVEAGDSRAAMMALAGVGEQRWAMARRTRLALDLAVDDDCDVLLASLGALYVGHVVGEDPAAAQRLLPAIERAVDRGRSPMPSSLWMMQFGDPPNCVPLRAGPSPDVELRDDELFLFDRFFHVNNLLGNTLVHGRLDRFDANIALLERHPHAPAAQIWRRGLEAIRRVVRGDELDDEAVAVLVFFAAAGPATVRLTNARAAVSVGGRAQAARLIARLDGPGSGKVADPVMQAVLALHDDRVVDAGGLITAAIDAERGHGWVELRPDLLELAAVVAARCDDHQRALVLVGAGAATRAATGVGYRFRDQQAWIDAAVAEARAQLGDAVGDELLRQGSTMSTDDALALAHRGRGARRRPPTGWDALTPTERQVLDLVVEGLTNPQIADRLLMSRATVKTHVSHCLTKLGMASRSEMAAAAARRGVTTDSSAG